MKPPRIFFLFFLGSTLIFARPLRAAVSAQDLKIIKEIRITGTKNFKARAVRELIRTRPKDFYSVNALEEDVREILGSGNLPRGPAYFWTAAICCQPRRPPQSPSGERQSYTSR